MKYYYTIFQHRKNASGLKTTLGSVKMAKNKTTLKMTIEKAIKTNGAFVGETGDYWVLSEPNNNGTGIFIFKCDNFIFRNTLLNEGWVYGKGIWYTKDIAKTIIKDINHKKG